MKAYPGAKVVDDDLAKRTAVTETNLIQKYGKKKGKQHWVKYKRKQSESNTFEYKAKKHGWTKNEFDEFNKKRSTTLRNMIERHGKDIGIEMWNEYVERQRYTTTIEYFIEKHGIDAENKWNEL